MVGGYGLLAIETPGWPQLLLRAGIMLTAVWIAAPGFKNIPRRVLIAVGGVGAVLVLRPSLILWGAAVSAIAAIALGRSNR